MKQRSAAPTTIKNGARQHSLESLSVLIQQGCPRLAGLKKAPLNRTGSKWRYSARIISPSTATMTPMTILGLNTSSLRFMKNENTSTNSGTVRISGTTM